MLHSIACRHGRPSIYTLWSSCPSRESGNLEKSRTTNNWRSWRRFRASVTVTFPPFWHQRLQAAVQWPRRSQLWGKKMSFRSVLPGKNRSNVGARVETHDSSRNQLWNNDCSNTWLRHILLTRDNTNTQSASRKFTVENFSSVASHGKFDSRRVDTVLTVKPVFVTSALINAV